MTQVMMTWLGKMSPRRLSSKGKKVGMADFGLRLAVTAQQMRITCRMSISIMLSEHEHEHEHEHHAE